MFLNKFPSLKILQFVHVATDIGTAFVFAPGPFLSIRVIFSTSMGIWMGKWQNTILCFLAIWLKKIGIDKQLFFCRGGGTRKATRGTSLCPAVCNEPDETWKKVKWKNCETIRISLEISTMQHV